MPRNVCCVPGCPVVADDGVPLHYFPNPETDAERFQNWVKIIGGDIASLDNTSIQKTQRICRRHFQKEFLYPKNRLCKLAVPSLLLLSAHVSAPSMGQLISDCEPSSSQEAILHRDVIQPMSTSTVENYKSSSLGVKTSIIYPATEKHIAKFSQQESHIVLETPALYEKLTLPHIEKEQFNLQWVYNILEGKSEQDRVVYDNKCERDGFVLVPDLKWDGLTKETLYLLAIVRRRGIKSLRDLNETHLPLLKRIRDEGKKKIYEKYKVAASQLRIYLHYQPSFYHLHVHFTYLRHEAPGIYAEKSHLLDTVIDNIEMIGDYYKRATLPFTIREMDNIFNIYETNGHVQRIKIENIELIDK